MGISGKRIDSETKDTIRRLLQTGLSRRKVAHLTHTAKRTVDRQAKLLKCSPEESYTKTN